MEKRKVNGGWEIINGNNDAERSEANFLGEIAN